MTSQLSWQPPPVTKCGECPHRYWRDWMQEGERGCGVLYRHGNLVCLRIFKQNKDGITPTCPAWQQQNKSKSFVSSDGIDAVMTKVFTTIVEQQNKPT